MTFQPGTRVTFQFDRDRCIAGTIEAVGVLGFSSVRADNGRLFRVPEINLTKQAMTRAEAAAIIDRNAAEAIRADSEFAAAYAERDAAHAELASGTQPALVIARLIDGAYIRR
jgi:hypothetical protein